MSITFSKAEVPYWCSIWARDEVSISSSPRLPCCDEHLAQVLDPLAVGDGDSVGRGPRVGGGARVTAAAASARRGRARRRRDRLRRSTRLRPLRLAS